MTLAPWRDRLRDRLLHPDRVPPEYQHLIPDDRQRVARILEIPIGGQVLEVGSSDGAMTHVLRRQGLRVTASDLTPQTTDILRWDVRTPWPGPERFDAVYCCEVLEHLTAAEATLAVRHVAALLRPGGSCIVTVPNVNVALHYVAGCRDRWRWPDHRSAWCLDTLQDVLARQGFRYRKQTWYPLYPPEPAHESIWLIGRAIL